MSTVTVTIAIVPDANHFSLDVVLEGATYGLELRWNERLSLWLLSVYDAAGTLLAAGRPVVLGAELLGRSGSAALPPGTLFAIDTSGKDLEAGRIDFGTRVQLVYIESAGA